MEAMFAALQQIPDFNMTLKEVMDHLKSQPFAKQLQNPEFFETMRLNTMEYIKLVQDPEFLKTAGKSTVDYIKAHPYQIIFLITCGVIILYPAAVTGMLGFGSLGPGAGTTAASLQSTFGTPLQFRIFQSAAMGGSWAPSVYNTIRGSAAVSAVIAQLAGGTAGDKVIIRSRL